MEYVAANGFTKIAYRKEGTGPLLVLIHGFPEDSNLWRRVVPALAARFTLLIPDLPGSGGSTLPQTDISIAGLGEAVIAVLDNEKVEKSIIAGHSMGGYVAIALAGKYPGRFKGLSMIHSTAAADDEQKKETRRKSISLIQKGAKDMFIRQMVPNLFAGITRVNNPELIEQQIAEGLELPADSMVAFYQAMMNRPDQVDVLPQLPFPVQWIAGNNDNLIPVDKVIQQSHLSSVNFVSVYNDCGHMSMLEKPGQLADDIAAFGAYCFNI